ncbi:MAG: hypothetical protein KAJ19_06795 [Gammaproteobacteria bacterium]|nr:hypothetical protein [Gammaproteobacteria bacterium]
MGKFTLTIDRPKAEGKERPIERERLIMILKYITDQMETGNARKYEGVWADGYHAEVSIENPPGNW